jgi:hypothetical protein
VLVAAVLGPEQREESELEVVRLALQELRDSVELRVGQAERAMERLFVDPRQIAESSFPVGDPDAVRTADSVPRRCTGRRPVGSGR